MRKNTLNPEVFAYWARVKFIDGKGKFTKAT